MIKKFGASILVDQILTNIVDYEVFFSIFSFFLNFNFQRYKQRQVAANIAA